MRSRSRILDNQRPSLRLVQPEDERLAGEMYPPRAERWVDGIVIGIVIAGAMFGGVALVAAALGWIVL